MSKNKKVCIVLGNGFTIDLFNYISKTNQSIWDDVDVSNLFSHGANLKETTRPPTRILTASLDTKI